MDATVATILSLLDDRIKVLEALGRANTNAIDDLLARVETLEEVDTDRLEQRVDDMERDLDRTMERIEEVT